MSNLKEDEFVGSLDCGTTCVSLSTGIATIGFAAAGHLSRSLTCGHLQIDAIHHL